jgi:hypothetical protein
MSKRGTRHYDELTPVVGILEVSEHWHGNLCD